VNLALLCLVALAPAAFATSNITTAANGDGIPYPTAVGLFKCR